MARYSKPGTVASSTAAQVRPLSVGSVVSRPSDKASSISGTGPSDASDIPAVAPIVAQLTAPQWTLILSLIFGGCCSNVFTLEAIVNEHPQAGDLITLVQFLFVASEGYLHFFSVSNPPLFLQPPHVPYRRYAIIVTLFFLVSFLNNLVWRYHISVPVHIIFRSGGTLLSLVVGYINGKHYSANQITSVFILTIGVISATLFDAQNKSVTADEDSSITKEFTFGISILFIAQALSAVMSQFTENTYRKYGSHWRENLFYMHFLTLPLFIPVRGSISREFKFLLDSKLIQIIPPLPGLYKGLYLPQQLFYLILNGATQYLCVRGVNNLAGNATALTVTIVLNVRKCASLLLSIYIFGNQLALGTVLGAALVFAGAAWYSIESSNLRERQKLGKSK
ncbi:UAA transporter [Lipomyces oligophaga]|uniref:UAA transporter n=1 Tax=Lipomyces oligophaga TaxID=45792 RepID=UPI0034CD48E6